MYGSCTAHGTFRPAPSTQSVARKLFRVFRPGCTFGTRGDLLSGCGKASGLCKATLAAPKVGRNEWIYWQHLVQVCVGEAGDRRRLYKQIGEKLLLTTQEAA